MIELCAIIVSDVWKKKKKQSDSHAISVLNERIEILAYFFTSVMFFLIILYTRNQNLQNLSSYSVLHNILYNVF